MLANVDQLVKIGFYRRTTSIQSLLLKNIQKTSCVSTVAYILAIAFNQFPMGCLLKHVEMA